MTKTTAVLGMVSLCFMLAAQEVLPGKWQRNASLSLLTENSFYRLGGHFAFGGNALVRFPLNRDGIPDGRSIRQTGFIPDRALYLPAAVHVKGDLYIIGGFLQDRSGKKHPLPGMIRYAVDEEGNLSGQKIFGELPEPDLYGNAAVVSGKYILSLGGSSRRNCYAAEILPNRELGPWKKLRPLPSNAAAERRCVVLGNKLFVCGSAGHKLPSVKLYVSELDKDGLPGKWRRSTNTPCPVAVLAADGKNRLVAFDGKANRIFRAELDPEGELGDWVEVKNISLPGTAPFLFFTVDRLKNGKWLVANCLSDKPRKFQPAVMLEIPEAAK